MARRPPLCPRTDTLFPHSPLFRSVYGETDTPLRDIRAREIPPGGAVVVASRRHGTGAELDAFLSRYKVADKVSAGSSLKFCLVASGRADLYPRLGRTME